MHPSGILQGATQQFSSTASFSDGTIQNVTTTATWSSSDPQVVTISNTAGTQGLATAVSVGAVTISAAIS